MKKLFLLRGLPASGKSTWIKRMNLEPYVLSSDKLREMYAGLEYTLDGNYRISISRDKTVWETLFKMLECRMDRGLTTIIDATHTKESSINKYIPLAEKYGYKIFVIDFTNVSLDECLTRNKERGYKQIPEEVIIKANERIKCSKIPDKIKKLSPSEAIDEIYEKIISIPDHISRIMFIGDVHGCLNTLKPVIENKINDNTLFVFTGDYIDRGPHSVETVNFLAELAKKDNFIFLEGNHERWLRDWAKNNIDNIRSKEFSGKTIHQFNKYFYNADGNIRKNRFYQYNNLVDFIDNLKEFIIFKTTKDTCIFACHGGIPNLNIAMGLEPSVNLIKGVGGYGDVDITDESFNNHFAGQGFYMVHGHRNLNGSPIRVNERVFNLEGSVERGGDLRTVTFILEDGEINYIECFAVPSIF